MDFLFAFTGRLWDEDVALQWNLNRWYDPATGRWISEDPIGFAAGDANLSRYVGNSPANFVDPFGLDGSGGGPRQQAGTAPPVPPCAQTAQHDEPRCQSCGDSPNTNRIRPLPVAKLARPVMVLDMYGGIPVYDGSVWIGDLHFRPIKQVFGADGRTILMQLETERGDITWLPLREYFQAAFGTDGLPIGLPHKAPSRPLLTPPQAPPRPSYESRGERFFGDRDPTRDSADLLEDLRGDTIEQAWVASENLHQLAVEEVFTGMCPMGGATPRAPNNINITQRGLQHVLERHVPGGVRSAGKSLFSAGEDIAALVRQGQAVNAVQQARGNFQRIVDAGRIIGIDRLTGRPTSIYTIITDAAGNLITMFPGTP